MIHETAIVAPGAELGENVDVGPYAVIDDHVTVGSNCRIGPRVTLLGHTTIGAQTQIHTGAVVGDEPQDHHYNGELSYTKIGENCTIREYVTIHRGAQKDSVTVIGNNVMLMGLSHVAHNAVIADGVIVANSVLLAGHVEVGEKAFISGGVGVHQFARIGRLAMVGGHCRVIRDIPPFCLFQRDLMQGLNNVGLKRAGMNDAARRSLKQVYRIFFRMGLKQSEALERIRNEMGDCQEAEEFVRFVEQSSRGIESARTGRIGR